jgi:hypothetical protein
MHSPCQRIFVCSAGFPPPGRAAFASPKERRATGSRVLKRVEHRHCTPTAGGSASPKGEARRERAAKPKQSAGRGRHAAHSRESEIGLRVGGRR